MDNTYEDCLKRIIFPELEAGRANWDRPHTEAVVEYIKTIIESNPDLNLDDEVLIIAAYAHDWGYAGLFKGGDPLSIDDVKNAKVIHMKIGSEKLAQFLKDSIFDFLSNERKERAAHLVKVHDKVGELKDNDELVLMEADTLGGLDIEKVKPSFDKNSNERYMQSVRSQRYPLFVTEYGKKKFEELCSAREDYYLKLKS